MHMHTHMHTHIRFTALLDFVWDYPEQEGSTALKQEIVSGSWAVCKSAP